MNSLGGVQSGPFSTTPDGLPARRPRGCPRVNEPATPGGAPAHGYCPVTDEDSDKAFVIWQCKGQPRCETEPAVDGGHREVRGVHGHHAVYRGARVRVHGLRYSHFTGDCQCRQTAPPSVRTWETVGRLGLTTFSITEPLHWAHIPRVHRGVVRRLHPRERGIDLGPVSEPFCQRCPGRAELSGGVYQSRTPVVRTRHTDKRSTTIVKPSGSDSV